MVGFALLLVVSFCPALQPGRIVHCPTAGMPSHLQLAVDVLAFPEDGLRVGASVGLWEGLELGASYGALRLIGRGSVELDPKPEWLVKLRILSEGIKRPAIAIGVDTRGFGPYDEALDRYEQKSRGAFVVASKNWWWLYGNLGVHAGVNYSFEEDFARGFSAFVGIDKDVKDAVGLRIEYDLAPGDHKPPRGKGRGFLAAALSIHCAENVWINLNFADILGNAPGKTSPARELFVSFASKPF